jgi:hypothetical protein
MNRETPVKTQLTSFTTLAQVLLKESPVIEDGHSHIRHESSRVEVETLLLRITTINVYNWRVERREGFG